MKHFVGTDENSHVIQVLNPLVEILLFLAHNFGNRFS